MSEERKRKKMNNNEANYDRQKKNYIWKNVSHEI